MFIWTLFEYCLVFISALFIVTQVIIPTILNKPIFPMFRKSIKNKECIEEEIRIEQVNYEAEQLRAQLENLKKEKEQLTRKIEEGEKE